LAGIQKQLQQLRDGTHGEYVKQLKKLDAQHKNEYVNISIPNIMSVKSQFKWFFLLIYQ